MINLEDTNHVKESSLAGKESGPRGPEESH